jgi:hypothetical protein
MPVCTICKQRPLYFINNVPFTLFLSFPGVSVRVMTYVSKLEDWLMQGIAALKVQQSRLNRVSKKLGFMQYYLNTAFASETIKSFVKNLPASIF